MTDPHCVHHGGTDPCPTCACGCGEVTGIYSGTIKRDGAIKGQHKKVIQGHQGKGPRPNARKTYPKERLENLDKALKQAIAEGTSGDDLIRAVIGDKELLGAIILAHVRKALEGNVPSTLMLLNRGLGTPKQGKAPASKADLSGIFSDPLTSTDDPYPEDEDGD